MLQQEQPNDYVLATGVTHTIRHFVEEVAQAFDMDIVWDGEGEKTVGIDRRTQKVLVRINPEFYRPAEVDELLGDPSKAERELGWSRKTDLAKLVHMMVRADDKRVANGKLAF